MDQQLTSQFRRRELVVYFVLAYVFSWAVEIFILLSLKSLIPLTIPLSIHYLAPFGPFLSAVVVVAVYEGTAGLRRLFAGLSKWRVERGYALFAIGVPFALFAVALIASRIFTGTWPDLRLLGQVDYLPYLGILPALGLWTLTYGLGEELGWRGFALPRLQANRSAFSATMILGVLWAIWHWPAFLYRDTYLAMGYLVIFQSISVLAASVILSWLYNGTRGSLLIVVLFHGLFDFLAVSSAGGQFAAVIMSALAVFWAVRVYNVFGRENLAPVNKQTI
jgi:membrane protease YdiL (CAAX protease family)